MASVLKYFFLFSFGGIVYVLIEMLWRGYSHWSMFILGGICFVLLGLINKKYTWDLLLNLNVWDYYDLPFNIMGQICLPYMFLWFLLSPVCIVVDDYIRYLFFNEEKPHYKLF